MDASHQDLAALLGSRICHDLISPIGAIGNGLELITMTGAAKGPEMNLIAESVNNAQIRIRFYRIAFGNSDPGQTLAGQELGEILDGVFRGTRVDMHWSVSGDLRRDEAKLVCLLVQCLETAMPQGGRLYVARGEGNDWQLTATSAKLRHEERFWSALAALDSPAELTSDRVQFALAALQAGYLGRRPVVTRTEDGLTVTF